MERAVPQLKTLGNITVKVVDGAGAASERGDLHMQESLNLGKEGFRSGYQYHTSTRDEVRLDST